ncbi:MULTISPECIES: nucleotide sugar dehydrogenase [Micromonospora]|uniref:UDP-glucose 6-dehydrogenase n=2 Tax=Micromonospora TaxID=1873 RepID=A0A9X0I1U2_9ACTN|nr:MULTISPECIES: nucleotide sugar dehydrogenase [Micromonospora]AEB46061.1 UDP-glucose 6-dehydrogenase [Micromonospora maris AB-18-032]AIS85456.1 UDP-glucose 6-dehydrogenase [Verrucosispora sp. MS100047]KUJ45351.1 UDP-glucose 6-dehydrogenase [Micromonospora maris]RUL94593.1 nucleotide sugar dehydrogenase [Verrucosispora sp. FIM060022]
MSEVTVGVLGLGYVGQCVAATLADRGMRVRAVDIDEQVVAELNEGYSRFAETALLDRVARSVQSGRLTASVRAEDLTDTDVVLIAVGTPVRPDGTLDDTQLRGACTTLGQHLRPGQLVLLKSTVPPGTTRRLVRPLLEAGGLTAGTDFDLAMTPERLAEGNALADLESIPMIVGGLTPRATRAAATFWHDALGVQVIEQDSPEAAEIAKLADNWWIDLNIALANELARFCALYEVDVLDVISAANTLAKGGGTVNILLPSIGVGGSCLTKDPWMVHRSAADHGLELRTPAVGRQVNAEMPGWTARLLIDELAAAGRQVAGARIAVLGLAFKNDTGDLRSTPVQPLVAELQRAGAEVSLYDPLIDEARIKETFGVRPASSLTEAVQDAVCVAVLAYHRPFRDIDFAALPVAPSCLVLDGRAYFPKETVVRLRELGYRYRGVGR